MKTYEPISLILSNEAETKVFAHKLAQLPLTGSVWLSGDLGAGKTTLTRYWLQQLGHTGAVKSPTYTLVEPYKIMTNGVANADFRSVYHADLYRLQDPEELEYIGFDEYLEEENALVIIEWASRAIDYLPEPILTIDITRPVSESGSISKPVNDNERLLEITVLEGNKSIWEALAV